jgi:transposase
MEITTVGLDLAKNVFQVHAIGSTGEVVVRRSLRPAQVIPFISKLPPCMANRAARVIWAIMVSGEAYRTERLQARK